MNTFADKQTLEDLNLTGKYKPGSIFSLFNKVQTRGGEKLLEEMFRTPLLNADEINRRSGLFLYFSKTPYVFPFQGSAFAFVEDYLCSGGQGSLLSTLVYLARKRVMFAVTKDEGFVQLREGIQAFITFLRTCRTFIDGFDVKDPGNPFISEILDARAILHDTRLAGILGGGDPNSLVKLASVHHLLTYTMQKEMEQLLSTLHQLDLFIAVGKVAAQRGFSFAQAMPEQEYIFHATNLRHPSLEKAVGNAITTDRYRNVVFLTGANMAGKSTFMKSFGVALYLGHMGFPVAANDMVFSVREGLYSSINVPDDLTQGYSHFYAEVQRVKLIADEVSNSRSLVVIFDELFKGTNVKDAYEATLAVTAAFAEYRNCIFIISTHIVEVGDALRETNNLQFTYLPTIMEGNTPRYTYQLREGISSDRHGMMIIEQEGILEMIRQPLLRTW
jgi:DNA mismatch repair ATPase MutS